MDQHTATPNTQERSSVGRRTVLKGAAGVAWTVPTVVALGTTAAAATSYQFSFDSLTPPLINAATTDSLVATGKGPKGAEISLTINGTSAGKVNVGTDGIWSKTFVPAVDVPEGKDVEVKATQGSTTFTMKYTKDTIRPVPTISVASQGHSGNNYYVDLNVGLDATNNPAGNGSAVVRVFSTKGDLQIGSSQTITASTPPLLRFDGLVNKIGYYATVAQTDGAGNQSTGTIKTANFTA